MTITKSEDGTIIIDGNSEETLRTLKLEGFNGTRVIVRNCIFTGCIRIPIIQRAKWSIEKFKVKIKYFFQLLGFDRKTSMNFTHMKAPTIKQFIKKISK